jgi:hypothetical protein
LAWAAVFGVIYAANTLKAILKQARIATDVLAETREYTAQTKKLAETAEIEIKLLRESFLASHRPWIKVRVVTFAKELALNESVAICIEFSNAGTTEARIVASNVTIRIANFDNVPWRMFSRLPQVYDSDLHVIENWIAEHHKDAPHPTLATGMTLNMVKERPLLPFQPHESDGLLRGANLAVWVFGYVFYQDGMGQHRNMGFCFRSHQTTDFRFVRIADPDLVYDF